MPLPPCGDLRQGAVRVEGEERTTLSEFFSALEPSPRPPDPIVDRKTIKIALPKLTGRFRV
jgi:hypothetical protein